MFATQKHCIPRYRDHRIKHGGTLRCRWGTWTPSGLHWTRQSGRGEQGEGGERVLGEGFSLQKDPTAEAAYFSSNESVASYFCIMRFASADSMQLPVQKRERKKMTSS